jgi:hypothetical protein
MVDFRSGIFRRRGHQVLKELAMEHARIFQHRYECLRGFVDCDPGQNPGGLQHLSLERRQGFRDALGAPLEKQGRRLLQPFPG